MSKEATIIQSFNDLKRQYEYFVKGYDVTESVKILLKRHKEEYDKEKKIFAGIDGYLEAQKEYQSQLADLEAKLAESEEFTQGYRKECAKIQTDYYKLKQQLAEKTLTIEQINKAFIENRSLWKGKYERANQYKITFAVEQLENCRLNLIKLLNKKLVYLDSSTADEMDDLFDNQIKLLKEGK